MAATCLRATGYINMATRTKGMTIPYVEMPKDPQACEKLRAGSSRVVADDIKQAMVFEYPLKAPATV